MRKRGIDIGANLSKMKKEKKPTFKQKSTIS